MALNKIDFILLKILRMKVELEYIIEEPDRIAPSLIPDLDVDYPSIHNLYLNSFIDKRYNNFLQNKSVVIIGPASYLMW